MPKAIRIGLTPTERKKLESWVRSGKTEQRLARRARIILESDAGRSSTEIARDLQIWPYQVSKWRKRFSIQRVEGLFDQPRSGKPRTYDQTTERRILGLLDQAPPKGYSNWSAESMAEQLKDVSSRHVWRVLKENGIQLQRRHSWCVSTDPEFAAKAADIVALYLNPPENAVVLCVDEKPHIQALERAQGWLRLPNGKAITGEGHRYKRHGTTTLFAALEVATGLVRTGHFQRRRRSEFLAFMNEVVREHAGRELHVVLDNLNIHKPKNDQWLARHKDVHFHFTPTSACWLNQIEIWFSILSRKALKGGSFTSPQQLRQAIDDFVQSHNKRAAPFDWRKSVVHPKGMQSNYSNLRR